MASAQELWIPLVGPFTVHGCFPSRYMAMRIAVSHVNRRDATYCPAIASLSNDFQIRYDLQDTNSNGIGAASAMMTLLGNETTKAKTKVVLGPNGSGSSRASSQILSVFGIPQISWASTAADLSNKASYPYYFRSVSPDSLVMRVLAGFVVSMGFKKVNLMFFDAPFQSGQSDDFRLASESHYKLEVVSFKLPNSGQGGAAISDANKIEVRKSLKAVRDTGCRIVIGLTINEEAYDLWTEADALGMVHGEGWLWLGGDGIAGGQIGGRVEATALFAGSIFVMSSSQGPNFQAFADRWASDMPSTDVPEFTTMPICYGGVPCAGHPQFKGWQSGVHDTQLACRGYTGLAYDALVTLAVVADRLITGENGVKRNLDDLTPSDWFEGMKSLHTSGHSFDCLSGEVSYDENQERPLPMTFYNWHAGQMAAPIVASWSDVTGYSWLVGAKLEWPNGDSVLIDKADVVPAGLPSGRPPPCSAGNVYDESASACAACPKGTRAATVGDAVACVPCDAGTYQPSEGQQACLPCAPGFASNLTGVVDCNNLEFQCKPGHFAAEAGATHCSACSAGRFSASAGSRSCTLCEEGTYQDSKGSALCAACQFFLPGSSSERGAENKLECDCPEGRYRRVSDGTDACVECLEGLECSGGSGPPLQAAGFFAEELDAGSRDYSVVLCRNKLECPLANISSCPQGREGRACNNCMDGHKPANNGTCADCGAVDFLPLLLLCLALVVVAVLAAVIFRAAPMKQSFTLLTVIATAGQLVTVVQTLGVLRQLSIRWEEPVKSLLSLTSLLTFDLDVISISCYMPRDDPVSRFVVQLLFYPLCAGLLGVLFLILRACKKEVMPDALFDFNGLILLALYISLALMVLLPYQCVDNPGGLTQSMGTNPGILCWSDPQHQALVGLATVGILVYPVGIFAWILTTTRRYPRLVSSGRGLQILQRYRFLFNRFKAEVYYYGSFMLGRNLIVALIPVALVRAPAIQLLLLCLVLIVGIIVQSRLWPWRTELANRADIVLTAATVLTVVAASPLLEISEAEKSNTLSVVILFPLLGIPLCILGILIYTLYARLSTGHQFGAFLCHHKGGAGSLGRFIKMVMSKHSSTRVFYDSDQLEDLDLIFSVVRESTQTLVIIVTSEVQRRMWCAGEMVSAHVNSIPITLLSCDGCKPLQDEDIEAIQDCWTAEQKNTLLTFGITMDMVKDAYRFLKTLPAIEFPRFGSLEMQETAIVELLKTTGISRSARAIVSESKAPKIMVTGAVSDAESLSTCLNLQMLIQDNTMVPTAVVRDAAQCFSMLGSATYLVVALSKELLRDPAFAKLLLTTLEGREEDPVEIVTVNADAGFQFPPLEFFKQLEDEGLGVSGLGPECGTRLSKAYRSLLSVLALPLSPHGSEGLLKEQVSEICRRFRNLQGLGDEGNVQRQTHVKQVNLTSTDSENARLPERATSKAHEEPMLQESF
eukprot:TRINITY_DN42014_c0_g1_i1.p1 TRINITY_DN42014_c0_g1~~TRINITY_DN42014_c0_g1_i1.p1  ORF type:complete len:1517 (-),score=220.07 TRINITY_DN42014_c0_g1_i1:63-4421(-)